MAMPSADSLVSDINALEQAGINRIVCLQTSKESSSLGLADEETVCTDIGMGFTRFAIEDFGIPGQEPLTALIDSLYTDIVKGKKILVHCKGGIGRSGLICCCVLVKSGMTAEDAIRQVSLNRQHPVPETTEQVEMINKYAHTVRHTR